MLILLPPVYSNKPSTQLYRSLWSASRRKAQGVVSVRPMRPFFARESKILSLYPDSMVMFGCVEVEGNPSVCLMFHHTMWGVG